MVHGDDRVIDVVLEHRDHRREPRGRLPAHARRRIGNTAEERTAAVGHRNELLLGTPHTTDQGIQCVEGLCRDPQGLGLGPDRTPGQLGAVLGVELAGIEAQRHGQYRSRALGQNPEMVCAHSADRNRTVRFHGYALPTRTVVTPTHRGQVASHGRGTDLIREEPVAELGVIAVRVEQRVGEVRAASPAPSHRPGPSPASA